MIDLITDNIKDVSEKATEMNNLARMNKDNRIKKIGITENKLMQEKQVSDQRKRTKIS
jgi:hypothetical protein